MYYEVLILTLFIHSNKGMRTNLMNPICAVGFVTLSRSMKGATGRPSDFSLSLCIKYSSRRQSTHGSETSIGRTSLEMSQHLISIICSWGEDRRRIEGGSREDRGRIEEGLREVHINKMHSGDININAHVSLQPRELLFRISTMYILCLQLVYTLPFLSPLPSPLHSSLLSSLFLFLSLFSPFSLPPCLPPCLSSLSSPLSLPPISLHSPLPLLTTVVHCTVFNTTLQCNITRRKARKLQ